MNSTKYVIVETALRPMQVVEVAGTDFKITEVLDFNELFAAISKAAMSSETRILVNRGPGSYSGIRSGIAYVYGLLHGGILKDSQILSYTSFDLIRAATGHETSIFLKAWPRVASGKLEGSKGYYEFKNLETNEDKMQLYKSWEDISEEESLLIVGEEEIKTSHEYRTYSEILTDPVGYRELINRSDELTFNLDPLYINPVHIT